jgi:hypothetical protein
MNRQYRSQVSFVSHGSHVMSASRPRYTKRGAANLPESTMPAIVGEAD